MYLRKKRVDCIPKHTVSPLVPPFAPPPSFLLSPPPLSAVLPSPPLSAVLASPAAAALPLLTPFLLAVLLLLGVLVLFVARVALSPLLFALALLLGAPAILQLAPALVLLVDARLLLTGTRLHRGVELLQAAGLTLLLTRVYLKFSV